MSIISSDIGEQDFKGGVAQMVERSLSMREVPGSIPGASKFFFAKNFCNENNEKKNTKTVIKKIDFLKIYSLLIQKYFLLLSIYFVL